MEAYVSKKANKFSDAQALQAMNLIAPNLRKVFHDGSNREAREKMMLGATLAGVAFSNASVALVHGMSRPIGAFYHVPHGLGEPEAKACSAIISKLFIKSFSFMPNSFGVGTFSSLLISSSSIKSFLLASSSLSSFKMMTALTKQHDDKDIRD